MTSLRATAQCIGLSGRISIIKDLYGYKTGSRLTLSLLTQVRLLQGKHIHLNLIRTATFDVAQQKAIDLGLQYMRNIYATVNVGIGRIQRFFIPPGHEVIDGDSGAKDLWNEFSVPNSSIDVFLARVIVGVVGGVPSPLGLAPHGSGSCDKDSKNDSGCVIGVQDLNYDTSGFALGKVIAHEVGHFLGLPHEDNLEDNLMYGEGGLGTKLYGGQGGVMVLHCSINSGCAT